MSSAKPTRRRTTGVYPIHQRKCATKADPAAVCNCRPSWQAWVPGRPGERPIRKNFTTQADARAWRADALVGVKAGKLSAPTAITVAQAADALLAGMRDGTITPKGSGKPYKPSTIRCYERALNQRVLPRFGSAKLSAITFSDVQRFADNLRDDGHSASTVRNYLDPLRVIYRRARRYGDVAADPTAGVDVRPSIEHERRTADEATVAAMIDALPTDDAEGIRALYTVAYTLGIRRGELRAMRWTDVDLEAGTIHITRGWDDEEGTIETKTQAGERLVPILPDVRRALIERKLATGRDGDDLVFGLTATHPFVPSTIRRRAIAAWKAAGILPVAVTVDENGERHERPLPWGLHEGRHSAATAMRAAGIDSETRMAILGHSSEDAHARYQHVRADHIADAAAKLTDHYSRHAAG